MCKSASVINGGKDQPSMFFMHGRFANIWSLQRLNDGILSGHSLSPNESTRTKILQKSHEVFYKFYNTPRFLIGIMLHVFRLSWEDGPQWSNAQAKLPRVFWLRPRLFSGTIEDEAKIETLKKRHGDLTCFSWYPLVINTHKYQYQILHCWLVVWNILYFPYIGNNQ